MLNGCLDGNLPAGHGARRVDLTNLPVLVLVLLLFAIELQLRTALSPETTTLLSATPSLVDLELAGGAVEGERGGIAGVLAGDLAVVHKVAVEEVAELGGGGGADRLVVEGWVGEGEVDVAP